MKISITAIAVLVLATIANTNAYEYLPCTESDEQSVYGGVSNEKEKCEKATSFDFKSLPTNEQRTKLCKCTDLIKRFKDIRFPRCKIALDGNLLQFNTAMESIFVKCNIGSLKQIMLTESQAGSDYQAFVDEDEAIKAEEEANETGSSEASGSDMETDSSPVKKTTKKPTTAPPTAAPVTTDNNAAATKGGAITALVVMTVGLWFGA